MIETGHGWMLVLAVALVGCSGTRVGTAGPTPGHRIAPGTDVLVMPTADFVDDDGVRAANSGSTATSQWRVILNGRGFRAETASSDSVETVDAGLRLAQQGNFDYLLESRITDWYDAGREWKEEPDRVELMARLYRVSDGELVAWGFDEEIGATSDDKVEVTHRLLSRIIRRLLTQFIDGDEVLEPPPDM